LQAYAAWWAEQAAKRIKELTEMKDAGDLTNVEFEIRKV